MFINPNTLINDGYVKGIHDHDSQVQPNGLDFTLDRLVSINHDQGFHISEQGKQHRGGDELPPLYDRRNDIHYWKMEPKTCYDGMSNIHVTLPEGVSAFLIIRSTFNRNGIYLTSGLYDQGFRGSLGFVVHNNSGPAYITQGTRIGQVVFVRSEDSGILYSGNYNTAEGQHWSNTAQTH